jgi:predicted ATPase
MRKIQQDAMSAKNVFANRIETVVFGNLEYNSRNDSFHLTKKDGRRIPSLNLASGIRSWGILQRLLAAGYLTPQSLLVIDEPETNLHPEWQVSMAQLLVELVDAGIPVLVNTHSNYMVDALKYFSDNKKLEAVTRFYWVEPEGDGSGSVTKNVTDDLEPIFHAFNRPFLRTMF